MPAEASGASNASSIGLDPTATYSRPAKPPVAGAACPLATVDVWRSGLALSTCICPPKKRVQKGLQRSSEWWAVRLEKALSFSYCYNEREGQSSELTFVFVFLRHSSCTMSPLIPNQKPLPAGAVPCDSADTGAGQMHFGTESAHICAASSGGAHAWGSRQSATKEVTLARYLANAGCLLGNARTSYSDPAHRRMCQKRAEGRRRRGARQPASAKIQSTTREHKRGG